MEPDHVTLLTLTGARPEAFAMCEYYVGRQTRQDFEWIVIDDGTNPTPTTMGQRVVRRQPYWTKGAGNTLRQNLLAGLKEIHQPGVVIFVEDDDWYHPRYVEYMAKLARSSEYHPLVGEGFTRYYNVYYRAYRENKNYLHASLCATAFRSSFVAEIRDVVLNHDTPFLDLRIFKTYRPKSLVVKTHYCVGIKGLPGRAGTGHAHRNMDTQYSGLDNNLDVLHKWIGEDAELYEDYKKGKNYARKAIGD